MWQEATSPARRLRDELAWVSSLEIAKRAGKDHKHVLEKVRGVMAGAGEKWRPNFRPRDYIDIRGKTQPMIEVSEIALPAVLGAIGGEVYTAAS
jgi:phage regulator Rha-like protein